MHWTFNTTNFLVLAAAYILSDAVPWLAFWFAVARIEAMPGPADRDDARKQAIYALADNARACRRLRMWLAVAMVLAAIGSAVYP